MPSKTSKKSSRETCFGTTHRVSISLPGPCTPNRYDPNVKIFPPAVSAAASERPRANDTVLTKDLTRAARRPSTISLARGDVRKTCSLRDNSFYGSGRNENETNLGCQRNRVYAEGGAYAPCSRLFFALHSVLSAKFIHKTSSHLFFSFGRFTGCDWRGDSEKPVPRWVLMI